jgi:hypothetical protein
MNINNADDNGSEGDGDSNNGNNKSNVTQPKLFFPYDSPKVFHQNIRDLQHKCDELLSFLHSFIILYV